MKSYWSIQGPSKAPHLPCIAFDKLDGSNLRFEWSRKQDWHKFGTRKRMFDQTDEQFGAAIPLFLKELAEPLVRIVRDTKDFKKPDSFIVYCEYWGPNSFAGWHDPKDADAMKLTLFDVDIHKRGFVLPRPFLKHFGGLEIPKVIFEGNFGRGFVKDVLDGRYDVTFEGVVAKGTNPARKSEQHSLWMAKAKTRRWLDELKRRRELDPARFKELLEEEEKEGYDL